MILAGDIGGTKTVLALAERLESGELAVRKEQSYASGEYASFEEILELFLAGEPKPECACFGIAGPVIEQRCQTTNLPWLIDGPELQEKLGIGRVRLLNDLEAMALGMLHLEREDFVELNSNAEPQSGNIAVIAAGTGLGEAMLYWDGTRHRPMATEGGHTDFAPQTGRQVRLLEFLQRIYPEHVSWERIVSGIGFSHLYDFLLEIGFAPACPAIPSSGDLEPGLDRNALISRLGASGEDPLCAEAVTMFAELYGAEAGNLALKAFAIGGLYIGGGIGPKIRSVLEAGAFLQAFTAKGRFRGLLEKIPVRLSTNPRTPLLGALHYFD